MPSCVVKSCKNYMTRLKKSQGITYHRFPHDKNRRDQWTSIIRNCRGKDDWKPSSSSTVCSAHFDATDFVITAKGLRCLVSDAIPKRLLSNSPETETENSPSPILQEVPVLIDESNVTGYCRLCATSKSNCVLINIESDTVMKELVVKMSDRLNTNIDFSQEHLPTTACSSCMRSLYMSYDFVVSVSQAQVTLNRILMQKHNYQLPVNLNQDIKVDLSMTSLQQTSNGPEASDFDQPSYIVSYISSETTSSQLLTLKIEAEPLPEFVEFELSPNIPVLLDSHRKGPLKDPLQKKNRLIDRQKLKIKTLNQTVRRFRSRNEKLKNFLKNLEKRNYVCPDLYNTLNENVLATDFFEIFNGKKLKKPIKYTKAIRKFCLTLNYYSPRAYDYLRQSFDTCLPHRKTLAKWYDHVKKPVIPAFEDIGAGVEEG